MLVGFCKTYTTVLHSVEDFRSKNSCTIFFGYHVDSPWLVYRDICTNGASWHEAAHQSHFLLRNILIFHFPPIWLVSRQDEEVKWHYILSSLHPLIALQYPSPLVNIMLLVLAWDYTSLRTKYFHCLNLLLWWGIVATAMSGFQTGYPPSGVESTSKETSVTPGELSATREKRVVTDICISKCGKISNQG